MMCIKGGWVMPREARKIKPVSETKMKINSALAKYFLQKKPRRRGTLSVKSLVPDSLSNGRPAHVSIRYIIRQGEHQNKFVHLLETLQTRVPRAEINFRL